MTNVSTALATGIFSGSAAANDDDLVDERALSKLRWRCRRGLLENDLLIERFFARHGRELTVRQARSLAELMELADNDLLDLLLGRRSLRQVDAGLDRIELNEILKTLKGQS